MQVADVGAASAVVLQDQIGIQNLSVQYAVVAVVDEGSVGCCN